VFYSEDQDDEVKPPRKKVRLDPLADLRAGATTSQERSTESISVEDELSQYKLLRVSGASTPILQYWQQQAADYPVLSTVARRLLCIPASSAQSERDFSSVGRTITDARSQLAASKVESIELLRWGLRAGLL